MNRGASLKSRRRGLTPLTPRLGTSELKLRPPNERDCVWIEELTAKLDGCGNFGDAGQRIFFEDGSIAEGDLPAGIRRDALTGYDDAGEIESIGGEQSDVFMWARAVARDVHRGFAAHGAERFDGD